MVMAGLKQRKRNRREVSDQQHRGSWLPCRFKSELSGEIDRAEISRVDSLHVPILSAGHD